MQFTIECFPGVDRDPRKFIDAVEEFANRNNEEASTPTHRELSICSTTQNLINNYTMAKFLRDGAKERRKLIQRNHDRIKDSFDKAFDENEEAKDMQEEAIASRKKYVKMVKNNYEAAIEAVSAGCNSAKSARDAAIRTITEARLTIDAAETAVSAFPNPQTDIPNIDEKLKAATVSVEKALILANGAPVPQIDAVDELVPVATKVGKAADAAKVSSTALGIANESSKAADDAFDAITPSVKIIKEHFDKIADPASKANVKPKLDSLNTLKSTTKTMSELAKKHKDEVERSCKSANDAHKEADSAQHKINKAMDCLKRAAVNTTGFDNCKHKLKEAEKELEDANNKYNAAMEAACSAALASESGDAVPILEL